MIKLQHTDVSGVRQVLTVVKGVREVRESQARFKVSFDRAINNLRCLLPCADTPALERARARRESEAVW